MHRSIADDLQSFAAGLGRNGQDTLRLQELADGLMPTLLLVGKKYS
jgi:hypothetical protein